jgi:inhibitor of cysteine peptidase
MQNDSVQNVQGEAGKKSFFANHFKFVVASFSLFCFLAIALVILQYRDSLWPFFNPNIVSEEGGIKKFQTYDELLSFMEDNANTTANSEAYRKSSTGATFNDSLGADSVNEGWTASLDAPSALPMEESSGVSDYSQTNVQVEGVDEGDITKTDGNYIYTVSGQDILIVKAVPAEQMEIVSKINSAYFPSGMYVNGDKLVVYGDNFSISPLKDYSKVDGNRNGDYANLTIYDVSDRKNPKKEKEYSFEGNYQESRMIGDFVYMVTMTNPIYIYYNNNQPVPYLLEDGEIVAPASTPNVYYFDFPYTSQNFTSVTAIDIKDIGENVVSETYVLDGNQNSIYVSENNIYVTFSKYVSEQELLVEATKELIVPRLEERDRERVSEIENTKSYILNSSEKGEKISAIFEKYYASLSKDERKVLNDEVTASVKAKYEKISREMHKTVVHKIGIDKGDLNYQTYGEVSGRVLNQFAMDESDGYFRIATTVDASWSRFADDTKSYNNLYVLDGNMKKVGEIEDIAEGEQIYSVRFMQKRAYMVTFRRTDPLFVIGLENPTKPEVLGKLKVPGYSTYLHPYDDNLLIGLGKNADESGREIDGIKLSLFDATDVENPKEIDTYILGGYGSDSVALSDHKAFLFSKEKNLLVIPAILRSMDSGNWNYSVSDLGSAVFRVNEQGFEYRAMISHIKDEDRNSYYYGSMKGRNLFIGDNLYSFSDNYIKVNKLSDLAEIKSLELEGSSNNVYRGGGLILPE